MLHFSELDLTILTQRCTEIAGPSSALPTEVSTSTWDPWASKSGTLRRLHSSTPKSIWGASGTLPFWSLFDLKRLPQEKNGLLYTPICKQTPKVNGTHQRMQTKRLIFEPHPRAPCTSSDGKCNMERDNLNCAWGPCWVLPRGLLDHKLCIMKMSNHAEFWRRALTELFDARASSDPAQIICNCTWLHWSLHTSPLQLHTLGTLRHRDPAARLGPATTELDAFEFILEAATLVSSLPIIIKEKWKKNAFKKVRTKPYHTITLTIWLFNKTEGTPRLCHAKTFKSRLHRPHSNGEIGLPGGFFSDELWGDGGRAPRLFARGGLRVRWIRGQGHLLGDVGCMNQLSIKLRYSTYLVLVFLNLQDGTPSLVSFNFISPVSYLDL